MSGEYVVAIFPSRRLLTRALDELMELTHLGIEHAAIVARARSGETVVLDDDLGPNEGSITGGTLGAAMTALGLVQLGALALPGIGPIIALGAGALVGGLVGHVTGRFAVNLIDSGYPAEYIEALAEQLEAGRPALVLQLRKRERVMAELSELLRPYQADLIEAQKLPALA